MRFLFTFIGTLILAGSSFTAHASEQDVIGKIEQVSSEIKSLSCNFTQTSKNALLDNDIEMTGKMYFVQKGRLLRWEYLSPVSLSFIMNGNKTAIKTVSSTQVMEVESNPMMKVLAEIMGSMLMGNRIGTFLRGNKDFSCILSVDPDRITAALSPLQAENRDLFSTLQLEFDAGTYRLNRIEMFQTNGDSVSIRLYDVKVNESIDETLFRIQ